MSSMKCDKNSKYNLRNKKKVVESSSDSDTDSDYETITEDEVDDDNEDDDDDDDDDDDENKFVAKCGKKDKGTISKKEFQKTLYELYPSK